MCKFVLHVLFLHAERTWNDVKQECGNYYDLHFIRQESVGHTFNEAQQLCHERSMTIPLTDVQDCVFWFVTKLGVNQAWILDKESGQVGISGRSAQMYQRTRWTVICAKRKNCD